MQRIDGKALSQQLLQEITIQVDELKQMGLRQPALAVVLVGEDPASQVYVRNKLKQCSATGIRSIEHRLPDSTDQQTLLTLIDSLNRDDTVDGILVQLPLPKQIDEEQVIQAILPAKDVDGFHPQNIGMLVSGNPNTLVPCTPQGCLLMLQQLNIDLVGKHVVVVGRSNIVGKPAAMLALQQHCTVTMVHSRSKDIESLCRKADILIVAVGRPQMVTKDWVKTGAIVIDVGINRIEQDGKYKLVGDVDFDDVAPITSAITPVPGGVGPMTIACLLNNTLQAYRQRK